MTHEEMSRVVAPHASISDKIRALGAAGCGRSEIAKFLNKRYQHVRNVLEAGPPKRSPFRQPIPVEQSPEAEMLVPVLADDKAVVRLPLSADGSIKLPDLVLRALGLRAGGVVIAEFDEDHLVLLSVRESVGRVQRLARELGAPDGGLAEALIADRRREAGQAHG